MNVIDSHLHFWNPEVLRYDWLDGVPELNRPFEVTDFQQAVENLPVDGVIFIEADCAPDQNVAEVEWVERLPAPVKGIVAFAPLESGAAARDALDLLAERPLVKGVRRLLQAEAPGFGIQAKFIEGVKLLADYNFTFDIGVRHQHLPDALVLVGACPDVHFVLNHIGKPNIAAGELDPWRRLMTALARFENVDVKFSGLVTEADRDHWMPDHLRPYADHVLETFTPARLMFGSDWPVCTLAASYARWFETAQALVGSLSASEQEQIFAGTAVRAYHLDT